MPTVEEALPQVRDSICAVMRIVRKKKKKRRRKADASTHVEIRLAFVGTAWCVVESKLIVTAHHVLNGGNDRDQADRFYVFTVPGNKQKAYHFPVVGFPLEDSKTDIAVLELGDPKEKGQTIPPVPVSFSSAADGSRVLTIGFPSPKISGANVNPEGEFLGGGDFFLKSHVNEGVIAAQYELDGKLYYEFNVGWHHGESGGPVFRIDSEPAVISIMQDYRNVDTPHGIMPGPHRGIAIAAAKEPLLDLGASEA